MKASDLPSTVRDSLTLLAESSDRTSPAVFAGRDDEFKLLDLAVRGTQRGEAGHTVVIRGVPGAGKTALLREYVVRSLAAGDETERPVIPVPLRPGDFDNPPVALLQEVDRRFREFEASGRWGGTRNRMVGSASLAGNALFAAFTKRDFNEFKASARAPNSLPIALDDYVAFRFDRRDSTILLLVDEAQNLSDTARVRSYLDALHGGIHGRTQVVLACFGLANTTARLRELGLSRLASGHVRSIGALSNEDAERTVTGTLEIALADVAFENGTLSEVRRSRWMGAISAAILAECANFPHHLANGCRALAHIVLDEGIDDAPPVEKLRESCREHKREYYDARLHPWARHQTALAHAFAGGDAEWTPIEDIVRALQASDDFGRPVDEDTAATVIEELCASGYVEQGMGVFRPVLPSLTSHFEEMQRNAPPRSKAVQAVRAALPEVDHGLVDGTKRDGRA